MTKINDYRQLFLYVCKYNTKRSVKHDSLRHINILTYLLAYLLTTEFLILRYDLLFVLVVESEHKVFSVW